jgi:hypothetical protein
MKVILRQKFIAINAYIKKIIQAVMPIILAIPEAEIRGMQCKASLGK